MRVLMTVSSTSLMDGIDRHILAIAPALNALPDLEVAVVTLNAWGDLNKALKERGVRSWALGCGNGHRPMVAPRFLRVMREFRPDLVHVHVIAFFESVVLKWRYPQVKRVVTIHGISDPVTKVPFKRRVLGALGFYRFCKWLSDRRAEAHIYVSEGVRAANSMDAMKSFVVYNPMEFAATERPSRGDGPRIVGTACRVENVKDPLAFTRIMGEVTKRREDTEAWIIGDGKALPACRELAAAKGYDRIRFWGLRNDAKVLIAKMDCFVLTSRREGMPTSLLEAMSVKTPVAFMDGEGGLGDLAEMNRTEGPFAAVAAAGDEQAMIEGICGLLDDREKSAAYAERAYEVARRHFDLDAVVGQLREVYLQA